MLENICIRILILDISEKKSKHELYGFTVHEEYNFYIKHFWKNESYKCDLAIRYAEGSRLQKLKEKYFVILQNEINEKINIDKDMISKKFHENMNEFQMLNKDQGDIHKNGRSVSKIEFDNGSILYYKPHSLILPCIFTALIRTLLFPVPHVRTGRIPVFNTDVIIFSLILISAFSSVYFHYSL